MTCFWPNFASNALIKAIRKGMQPDLEDPEKWPVCEIIAVEPKLYGK
jgi:hypothetical protein